MKKIGIVSCYFKNNYGSMLQAYATKKILDNNNIENETINVDYNKDFKKGKVKYYMTQVFNFNFIKTKFGMIKLKFDKKIVKDLGKNISIRNNKYKEFRKEFNLSEPINNYGELSSYAKDNYSNILLGSDQLWLPVNIVADYYTLNWSSKEINTISYSTSFGISNIPKKYDEKYKEFLSKINYLSTRENSGVKIIENYGLESKLVCDPTMLLTIKEWEEVATKKRIIKDDYIFCYFLGSNKIHREFVLKLKKETGLKIVSLNHADEYVKISDEFADKAPYDIGPKEWINLIKHAEYVCTDSFHGTVFSLIFNKVFFNFQRHNAKSKMSTNTRIYSLLDMAGVSKERILIGDEKIKKVIKYKIDYNKVNQNINQFREESLNWLMSSLKIEEFNNKLEKDTNEKVKILYFVDRLRRGGIQSLLYDWATRIDKEKFDIEFLVLDDKEHYELEGDLINAGFKVNKLKNMWINTPLDFIKYDKILNNFFKENNDYKVIHLNGSSKNYQVLKYAKKYNIPIRISHSHNTDFQTKNILKKLFGNILKNRLIKYSTDYFACSKIAGEWLFGKDIVNSDKFQIIKNAVDYDKFKFNEKLRKKIRKEYKINDETVVIGNVGRFTNQKNHTFLIDIFYEYQKLNKDSKLMLIGTGILEDEIKEKVNSLGIKDKVIFAGFKTNVSDYLNAFDLFLMPSLYEGLPVTGVEAQASGLPCVFSSTITEEIKIASNVKYIELEKNSKEWAEIIKKLSIDRKDNKYDIIKSGYEVKQTIESLEQKYNNN